jgi:uncharacterized protein YidB (DUF937 family)
MGQVLIALAPVVLAMLGNAQRGRQPAPGASTGGGLADVLGKMFGAGSGSSGMGGLGGLIEQFQRAGFRDQADSWVSTGQNMPLPPGALERTFGRSGLAEIARMAGVSETDAESGLSQLIPEMMVDRVTPNGQVPDKASLLASLSDLSRRLGAA